MWKLYCLPGRIFTELGFLFPGKNQLWASARRRESGVAAFIYATIFWAVCGFLILPMIAVKLGGGPGEADVGTVATTAPGTPAPADTATTPDDAVGDAAAKTAPRTEPPRAEPAALPENAPPPKPKIVFAAPREVAQPIPPENAE